jgi:glutathione S-transferase
MSRCVRAPVTHPCRGLLASKETPMKLHWSPRSPFVRKVMIVAHDTGVAGRIERIRTVAAMMKPHPDLMIDNPLSKIPTLVLDNGTVLYDSAVICEYLDHLHDGVKLFPLPFEERMTALRRQALGDGLLDALVLWRGELSRPAEQQSQPYLMSFSVRNEATLAALEREAPALESSGYSIGHVAIGCALCYLDFRFADRKWRGDHPLLARWHATFAARASVGATEPVDDS